jgi:hypothetical protein
MMKSLAWAAPLSVAACLVWSAARASPAPCEVLLKDLRTLKAASKASAADKARALVLENKGLERCTADDDKRADDFFAQAAELLKR